MTKKRERNERNEFVHRLRHVCVTVIEYQIVLWRWEMSVRGDDQETREKRKKRNERILSCSCTLRTKLNSSIPSRIGEKREIKESDRHALIEREREKGERKRERRKKERERRERYREKGERKREKGKKERNNTVMLS
jgi:hypothetical protein